LFALCCPKLNREPPVYVDPMVTRPFESITNVLEPPEMLENTTTFDPRVPGPTLRVLLAKRFVVVTAFDAYTLPMTWTFAVGVVVPTPIVLPDVILITSVLRVVPV
jgi:hypothetical protein